MDMQHFFQRLVDRFIAGDLETVAKLYVHPLIIYRPTGITIERTPEDTVLSLAERLISIQSGGATSVRVTIDEMGTLLDTRQPFDVTWRFLNRDDEQVGISQLRYFCRMRDGHPRIELVDILQSYRQERVTMATAVNH